MMFPESPEKIFRRPVFVVCKMYEQVKTISGNKSGDKGEAVYP